MRPITREEAAALADEHGQGWHADDRCGARSGCPECDRRDLSSYPTTATTKENSS